MKVRPLHDRVLLKRIEEKEVVKGGIIIPDTAVQGLPAKGSIASRLKPLLIAAAIPAPTCLAFATTSNSASIFRRAAAPIRAASSRSPASAPNRRPSRK